jgi:putative transposase
LVAKFERGMDTKNENIDVEADAASDNTSEAEERSWLEACRREEAVRKLLKRHEGERLKISDVEDVAWELGVSRATLYRLTATYRRTPTVKALEPKQRGRRKGALVLDKARHNLIHQTIREVYLKPTRPTLTHLVEQVHLRFAERGWSPPDRRTVQTRVEEIEERVRARKRQDNRAIKATTPVPGQYTVSRPLEVVQIDHTLVDIIIVDEETREALRRPWLTLAIDVFTRMVTGFHLSMDPPSRLSTSLCLLHAVYDKTAWLQEREIDASWPVAGLPESFHLDNGADFRSMAFIRGCRNEGVAIIWRPPGEPHYGGHIERLIGTMMGKMHLLPGTSFGNPTERGKYDSKKNSGMSLRELELYLGWEIAGGYHDRIHSALMRSPMAVWREHEQQVNLRMPQDRMAFWTSFLPEERRRLRPDGIWLHGLPYWSNVLSADLGRAKRDLLVKYDPRDISRIFVQRPSGNFIEARSRDLSFPSISLREWATARAKTQAQARGERNARQWLVTAQAKRRIVDEAIQRTAQARRYPQQNAAYSAADADFGSLKGVDSRNPSALELREKRGDR